MPRLSATLGLGLFFVFAATMGVTVGVIVSLYTRRVGDHVVPRRVGDVRGRGDLRRDDEANLNSLGGFLFMGMIGLLVASVVNIWLGSGAVGWAIALIGVVVFTVYTAYDVQKISYGDYAASLGSVEKASVLGAIHLYINFVNIFLFLLRLTAAPLGTLGSRRRSRPRSRPPPPRARASIWPNSHRVTVIPDFASAARTEVDVSG